MSPGLKNDIKNILLLGACGMIVLTVVHVVGQILIAVVDLLV